MKLAVVFLALVGFVAAASFDSNHVTVANKDFLYRQRFLLEIVYRVEDPLMFEEWIKMGKFIGDHSHYAEFTSYMDHFMDCIKYNVLLPQGEFFGALVKTHLKQAYGLFEFFYYAKDFETFMHNVAWARMHVNEGMFIYALNLAVMHRDDFKGLVLPQIYEIFPQYFFNSKFIFEAEKFDYEVFSKYIMYEKEYKDMYYYTDLNKYTDTPYFFTKDWKTWQWWKMMGLDAEFYPKDVSGTIKYFYMPVDYSRDINIFNEHSQLSYFTEDLEWNSYWYYFNLDYSFFLDSKTFGFNKERRGEYWIYNVQQILSRYYLERLSNGFGEIPEFTPFEEIEYGYDSQLIYYNGVGFTRRENYYNIQNYVNYGMFSKAYNFFKRVYDIIDTGYFVTADGHRIDMRVPESINYIGNFMQGNVDQFDQYFFQYWYMLSHMYMSEVDYSDFDVFPNVFLNFETMMRDPMFYMFHKKIASVFYHFKYYLTPYTHEELFYPGVQIKDVHVSELKTYYDLEDFDVTNLLNDKMVFHDGAFVWDKTLLARQARLDHKPFDFDFTIKSEKEQKVVIRAFLGPKFDEYGRVIPLSFNRQNFYEIDSFIYTLTSGDNKFKRSSKDFRYTYDEFTSYTDLYKNVMLALEGKMDFELNEFRTYSYFPNRLILPQGWVKGMPVQFFFFVTPYVAENTSGYEYTYIDSMPFGYPFDREIDETEFFVPNMYIKDVLIYHVEKYQKYFNMEYEGYGTFDESF